ncbi:MAG: type II glyceraldehyde-3-phosphate dehydrogenase [Gammaproteobacteria bacterium TMED78]|nr:MAG: type II glyceraldehyde-3-phosphate dehydrogenase [Gammaproteobacteria bacterium TMED78]
MVKVLVAGYGVIGQRLADGIEKQDDMELVGVVDAQPTLSLLSLKEKGMPYRLYAAFEDAKKSLESAGYEVAGTLEDILPEVDIVLDATSPGVGAKNKELYIKYGKKAVFQGGEKNDIADVFFHGYANYEKGINEDFLKLTSCNTTGLIRVIDALDRKVGIERVAITIVRRVADPGDYHRGLVNALQVDKAPNHQAVDLMNIMPHIDATGLLVHTPITHGHFISVLASPKEDLSIEEMKLIFSEHDRIRVVSIDQGFLGNASIFRYARDMGYTRGDIYEVPVWEDTFVKSGKDVMFGIHIPQESVTIPETIDAIRASTGMQTDRLKAVSLTNKNLGLPYWK